MQNPKKYVDVVFATTERAMTKACNKPQFKGVKPIGENLALVFRQPPRVILDRPYIVGFAVLELSKNYMYRLFYDEIRPHIPSSTVLMSDTDSFILQ